MDFNADFFRDEVRDGFYISTAIKQTWAAQMEVLSEIDRVCKKHGIKYFHHCTVFSHAHCTFAFCRMSHKLIIEFIVLCSAAFTLHVPFEFHSCWFYQSFIAFIAV